MCLDALTNRDLVGVSTVMNPVRVQLNGGIGELQTRVIRGERGTTSWTLLQLLHFLMRSETMTGSVGTHAEHSHR